MATTKKNPYLERAQELSKLSILTDITYAGDKYHEKEYKELKREIKKAQMDNILAAMEAYCKK